jgi:hypothetical protein
MKRRVSNRSRLQRVLASSYWRAEDAEQVLAIWRRSNLSMAAFARKHGLVRARLVRWQRRLKSQLPESKAVAFHPVRVVMRPNDLTTEPATAPAVELVLTCGRRVAVRRGFDVVTLEELVRVVESWPC